MTKKFRYKDIYHPVPPETPHLRAELIGLWDVHVDGSYARKNNLFSDDGVFITWKGSGHMTIFSQEKQIDGVLDSTSFVFLKKGERVSYFCPEGTTWEYFVPHFKDLGAISFLGLRYNTFYPYDDSVEMKNLCEKLLDGMNTASATSRDRLDGLLHDILVRLAKSVSGEKFKWSHEIAKARSLISERIDRPLDISELLASTGMNRVSLFKYFRKYTGQTPIQYALTQRLEMARQMLLTTDKKVYEISEKLSFYDEYHFSRLFKRKFGLSPDSYRKKRID